MILAAAFSAFFLQAQPVMLNCASATAQGASGFTTLVCAGEREVTQGEAAQKGTADARRHFENAVEAYRKAEAGTSVAATLTALLEILARLYDAQHLNEPAQAELVFRELAGINPDDLTVLFRLSRAEEDQGQLDAAENTLLYAHHLRPDNPEPDKMLAQFFARRVTDLSRAANDLATAQTPAPKAGEPDKDGFYRVGGDVPAPRRLDNPKYPPEAQDVGIQGVVIAEISLNEQGTVTDIRIVQSVPLLDQAAIDAVHNWRYEPAMLNGRPVPAKMTVTVNFSLRK